MGGGGNEREPRPDWWRVPPGQTHQQSSHEQDDAAGGRHQRQVRLADGGTATASIRLRPLGLRVYAYLRYAHRGQTITRYVGDVTARTRVEALRRAWGRAHEKDLLRPD